jgi:hypothetical protein
MTLTPSQIEVLARFDGWVKEFGGLWRKPEGLNNTRTIDETAIEVHLTSPAVLIEMRLRISESISMSNFWLIQEFNETGRLILSGQYTAAAIKTSEIIQKLEA